jgi:hypothetical protein
MSDLKELQNKLYPDVNQNNANFYLLSSQTQITFVTRSVTII